MFYFRVTQAEAVHLKRCLDDYAFALGQLINYQKSIIAFSKNTSSTDATLVSQVLNVSLTRENCCYLSLPSWLGRNKTETF